MPVLAFVAALVALLAIQELLKLSRSLRVPPLRWPTYIFVGLFFLFLAMNPGHDTPLLSTAVFAVQRRRSRQPSRLCLSGIGMRRADLRQAFPAAMASTFAFTYIALPLGCLVQIREQWVGRILLLYLLLVVWAGDIFAYFVGKFAGTPSHVAARQPKKTWEGALASVVASVWSWACCFTTTRCQSASSAECHLIEPKDGFFALQKPPLWPILLLSTVVNIAAQLGDLVESLIKRGAE